MGRKTKETSAAVGEAESQRTQPLHETTAERRKKQKNKDEEEAQLSSNPKRLLLRKKTQILLTRRRSTRNPKRRKKEPVHNQEPPEIGYADKRESGDVAVVVTGKDAKEAKYKPLTSFAESKLPSDVIQCCQNFKSPSQ